MRKALNAPEDLQYLPSYLGHIFRLVYFGYDDFDYARLLSRQTQDHSLRDQAWKQCRDHMGMHSTPDEGNDRIHRQQYTKHLLLPEE